MSSGPAGPGSRGRTRAAPDGASSGERRPPRPPAYMYLKSDGALPKAPPGSNKDTRAELVAYWQGQERFETGLAQETSPGRR